MALPTKGAPRQQVLIVGAGLAGLSLAQGLKKHNPSMPFHIFERDASSSFRTQGYRIRISPDGAGGLKRLLPERLWRAFEATSADVVPGAGSRVDAMTGEHAQWARPLPPALNKKVGGVPASPLMHGKQYNVDRRVLREVLLDGLEEHISFGKKSSGYQVKRDGSVAVGFTDGTIAEGSILIGADGVRSSIRHQLFPDYVILDTEGRSVFGKTFLTPEVRDAMPDAMSKGLSLIGESQESYVKLFSDTMSFRADLPSDIRSRYHVPADYFYWVLSFRKDACKLTKDAEHSEFLALTCQESVDLSLELTKSWHSSIRAVLEKQDVPSASSLMFYTSTPESFHEQWDRVQAADSRHGPVTLLGDAAHPMPPIGGVGANSAFQEAADLCEALTELYGPGEVSDVGAALREYQTLMVGRASAAITSSAGGAGNFFGMRPVAELKAVAL